MRLAFRPSALPFLLAALAACAGEAAPPAAPPPAAPPPAPAVPAAPAPVVDANPTERTPEQKARDDARAPLANAIMDAFPNALPRFSPDGKKLLFVSRRDGNREFYVADVASPAAPPVLVTHGTERASDAVFTRDGKSVLFLRDTGADENFRIYKVGLDGKDEVCLTPGAVSHRSLPFEPRGKHGTLIYSQHDVKSPANEVVVQPIGGEPKVVYTDPSPGGVIDVAPDGKRALVLRFLSYSDKILLELDLATAQLHRLYPAEGAQGAKGAKDKRVSINDAAYSADGRRVFVSSDEGGAAQTLLSIDAKTGAVGATYVQADPPSASIAQVVPSPRGDKLAIQLDMGDHAEARLLDPRTLKVTAKVDAPLGDLQLSGFREDGTKLGVTFDVPDKPADVYAVDAKTGHVEPLRSDPRAGLEKLEPLDVTLETVKGFDGLPIPVIVNLPHGAKGGGKRLPVLAEFHGGPASSSTIGWDVFARFYTALGYAYLQPNVRGSTGYGRAYEMADNREKRADWLKDLESVNAWIKAQPWADPARVVVTGGSYGGYTVLMALTRQPSLWRAGIEYAGVVNLFTFLQSTDQVIRSIFVEEFGDLDKDKALLDEFSPLRDKDKIVVPLYAYAGQNDPRVPRSESDQIVRALRERKVPVEYQVAANEGHSLDHRENRIEFLTRTARFLEDNLK
jgi:dipeptidyl aminopeptidase/acylaminoacyl peptidase